ncbi:hypothetical protein A8L34_16120 [Bacillus sp. FJAT-27264]|uniref:hypothetical protein n=1 Tax=Paenibacillus sp. (strain DSM 101736 / FJAT-27264) TaxID=1850362 RepID=UPI000807D6A0|nr:hypothetical protein [Bacillus sp. FJAT-27264]OBZ11850.1 hypothetical protein A8L34_16120 [Bacillus sp. FJAT-27264]
MNNIQSDVILEFQKSIDNMTRFGQEMETLDARFGKLYQRINAMKSSLSGLQTQVSRGSGGNLRQSLTNELNNLISGNGIVMQQLGSAGLTIKRETIRDVLGKVENEINQELRKHARNMNIEIDPNYASGQKLPMSTEGFNEINKEVAGVIKLQISNLVNAIQSHSANLIKPEALEGLQITVGKETVMAFVNKIKSEVLHKLANPNIAEASDLKITKADLSKVVKEVKGKLLKAINMDIPEMGGLDVYSSINRIPKEIENNLKQYVNRTVEGINGAIAGKAEIPIDDLSMKLKSIIAQELDTSVEQLNKLGPVDIGSVRGSELKDQLEKVTKTIDKKMKNSITEEISGVVRSINGVEFTPEPKLKLHLVNQINRINNALIKKIREQVDVRVQSIIQEINDVQSRSGGLNRNAQIRNAGDLVLTGQKTIVKTDGGQSKDTSASTPTSNESSIPPNSSSSNGLFDAVTNTIRRIVPSNIVRDPTAIMKQGAEIFKNVQIEQVKMTQNLKRKDEYNRDSHGNPLASPNMVGVANTVNELQTFIRQQSILYGNNYYDLYKVGGMGSNFLSDPVEIKKFVQLTSQLQSVDPGSNPLKIANGLENIQAQFGLEMADMEEKVARPLAAVSTMTKASVEKLIEATKRSDSAKSNSNVDPETAIVLAGTSMQTKALEGANIGNFYNSILNRLQPDNTKNKPDASGADPYYGKDDAAVVNRMQSPEAMKKLQDLGLASMTESGAKLLVPANELFKSLAQKLSGANDLTKRNTYDTIFGTYQSSKGAATMHEIMNTFGKVSGVTDKEQYDQLIKSSLNNPLVNTNRAKQSYTIAFDSLIQEMTPAINKVSYALINMADNVAKNAQLFASLGDIMSSALIGMMMLKGIKWGAAKVGPEVEREKQRTGFLSRVNDLSVHNSIKTMSRKQIGAMQQDPLLERYVRDLNGMTEKQQDHFKNYLTEKGIVAKDLPTLFTTMDEAKNWEQSKKLTDTEKFERTKQYHNRLSTRPELASVINPHFLNTLNYSTGNQGEFSNFRTRYQSYSSLTDKMSSMSQSEFKGFENHLVDRQRNGLPPINSFAKLSSAMEDYEKSQRQAAQAARQATPIYGSLSHAVRGMNSAMSSTASLKNGFKQFLKDIPELGRGALSSIKNLAGGIAKMGLQMVAAIALGQAAKGISEGMLLTEDQRLLSKADTREKDNKYLANMLKEAGDGGLSNLAFYGGVARGMAGSVLNGISSTFGGNADDVGYFKLSDDLYSIQSHYGFNGNMGDFANWLKDTKGLTMEEAVNQWYKESGKSKETEAMRQEAINKQYEEAQLKKIEEERMEKVAKEAYEKKYKSGEAKDPSIDADTVLQRISNKMQETEDSNKIATLDALLGGMKTDSDEYIQMRKNQTAALHEVLNNELAIIDKYIANAKEIMDKADPSSEEYANAKKTVDDLTAERDKIAKDGEAKNKQEEFNTRQETYESKVKKVTNSLSKIDLLAQAKELAAAYNMDNGSQAYLDTMKKITLNKISSMKTELKNLKAIEALGDLSTEQELQVLQLQNSIASEQARIKEYNLASIGIGRAKIQENNSNRENDLLALKLKAGNPDDSSSILRNKRIANAKAEVSEISQEIRKQREQLPSATADEANKINAEIRELQKQSLQTQLGILDEMKSTAGTFNMPDGVSAMTRYEYLTRGGTHNTTTIGNGDVTVNITLPNVTNGMTASQLSQVGQSIGQGLSVGRVGGLRSQQAMHPRNYRS